MGARHGGNNGLTEHKLEFRILTRLIRKYADDPETVAFDLTDVNASIEAQINANEYADTQPIRLLQTANSACISFIRETEPDIAAELDPTYPRTPQVLDENGALLLQEAWRVSVAMMDAPTAETTIEDAAEILKSQIIDAGEAQDIYQIAQLAKHYRSHVLRRQISRLAEQARAWITIEKLARHYDEDMSKAAGVLMRYGGVAGVLLQAAFLLWRLLGSGERARPRVRHETGWSGYNGSSCPCGT